MASTIRRFLSSVITSNAPLLPHHHQHPPHGPSLKSKSTEKKALVKPVLVPKLSTFLITPSDPNRLVTPANTSDAATQENDPASTIDKHHPHLIATKGSVKDQMQSFLSVAERQFINAMVPKAASKSLWAKHMTAHAEVPQLPNLATLSNSTSRLYESLTTTGNQLNMNLKNISRVATNHESTPISDRVDMMARILGLAAANNRMVTKWNIQRAIECSQVKYGDTGSTSVQVAVLTVRINNLKKHIALNRKDKHNSRALIVLLSKRMKLLKYLKRENLTLYYLTLNNLEL